MKRWLATRLRNWADLLDRDGGMAMFAGYFKIVRGRGMLVYKTEGAMIKPPAPGTQLYFKIGDYRGIEEDL